MKRRRPATTRGGRPSASVSGWLERSRTGAQPPSVPSINRDGSTSRDRTRCSLRSARGVVTRSPPPATPGTTTADFAPCTAATASGDAFGQKHSKNGLPVVTVDDEIYRLPGLVIATADKFAAALARPATALFIAPQRCERHGYRSTATHRSKRRLASSSDPLPAAKTVPNKPLLSLTSSPG